MTRVSDLQIAKSSIASIHRNRVAVDRMREQLSSGLRVAVPGDDATVAATISQLQNQIRRDDKHTLRIQNVRSALFAQDNIINEASNVLVRAKEIATQGSNETNGVSSRQQMAEEVFQLRDHLINLANSKFQGHYIYGGVDDDDPPYDAQTYTNPATGAASQRYVYDAEPGTDLTKEVKVTDELSITVNTPGDQVFDTAIQALERLGRALRGYATTPPVGDPDGGGAAYTFPDDFATQTEDITNTIDLIETARSTDLSVERTNLAGRLARLDTAEALVASTQTNVQEVLTRIQNADTFAAASELNLKQTALESSLAATARTMGTSILDYL
jgi:flagellar hook-associated protein 3 FlgL